MVYFRTRYSSSRTFSMSLLLCPRTRAHPRSLGYYSTGRAKGMPTTTTVVPGSQQHLCISAYFVRSTHVSTTMTKSRRTDLGTCMTSGVRRMWVQISVGPPPRPVLIIMQTTVFFQVYCPPLPFSPLALFALV